MASGAIIINSTAEYGQNMTPEEKNSLITCIGEDFQRYTIGSSHSIIPENEGEKVRTIITGMIKQTGKETVVNQLNEMFSYSLNDQLAKITDPVMIIFGGKDLTLSSSHSLHLRSEIKTSQIVEFPYAGHALHISHYRQCNSLIRNFTRKYQKKSQYTF